MLVVGREGFLSRNTFSGVIGTHLCTPNLLKDDFGSVRMFSAKLILFWDFRNNVHIHSQLHAFPDFFSFARVQMVALRFFHKKSTNNVFLELLCPQMDWVST